MYKLAFLCIVPPVVAGLFFLKNCWLAGWQELDCVFALPCTTQEPPWADQPK